MSEVTRGEIQDIVSKHASDNASYRAALLANPKAVLARQMNRELPDWLNVKVVEESADTIFVIAPYAPVEGGELADAELERVAGGGKNDTSASYTCNDIKGIGTHVEITTDMGVF